MLTGLLNLALLGTTVTLGLPAEFAFLHVFPIHTFTAQTKTSARTNLFLKTAPEDRDRDCLDEDTENSHESASSKQRTQEFGGAMNRHVLARYRARLQQHAEKPSRASLPLFYAFCALLI